MTSQTPSQPTHMTRDEAFGFLDTVARGLAATFGPFCEALVQEVDENGCCTVLSIYNGQISGRQTGSTLSIYGSDTKDDLPGSTGLFENESAVCLEARTTEGRRVKSSTWMLRGADYALLLGVNLDITSVTLAEDVLEGLASVGGDLREHFDRNEGAQDADSLIDECLETMGRPAEALSRGDRTELVRLLNERGFFEYQRSATTLAERLGVSRSTIYNDLKHLQEQHLQEREENA